MKVTEPTREASPERFRLGLGLQLIALIVVVVFFVGGLVGIVVIERSQSALRQEILGNNLDTADLAAHFAASYLEAAQTSLLELAGRPSIVRAVVNNVPERVEPEMKQFLQHNKNLDSASIYDVKGIGRASGLTNWLNRGGSIADRDWFQHVMATGKPYLGVPVISRGTGQSNIPYGVPILDQKGTVRGALVGGISLATLSDVITAIRVSKSAQTSLIDFRQGGIILAHVNKDYTLKPVSKQNEAIRRVMAGERGTMETRSSNGESDLAAFTPVPNLHLGVLITEPSNIAFAPVDILKRRTLLLIGIAVLVTVIVGALLAIQITRPLIHLKNVANELAAGDLTRRVNITRRDEIGQLGLAFDQMAAALSQKEAQLREYTVQLEQKVEERTKTLQESEERFRIAAESGSDLIWEWDIVKGGLAWFGNVDERLGYDPGEFPRTIEAWENIIHPEDNDSVMRALDRHLQTREPYLEEYRVFKKDESIRYWLDSGTGLWDEEGKAYKMIGAVSDITERKQAEEEIKRLNEKLEQRVLDRTAQLEAANKELEAFSYSVSHDLRSPLRAIDGFSHVLSEEYSEKLDEEGIRLLNIIQSNTQNMGKLIDDLLAFARLGRQEIKISEIEMDKLAKTAFEELKSTAQERKLQFNVKPLPTAEGDRAMIRQVFVNLLSNAIKFTRPKEASMIEVSGWSDKNENVYCAKDNGVGFDMQYSDKLFGVFQRLHSTAEFEGTGVGLAIVQRIIHRHGGKVWANGKINEGAMFYFTLPKEIAVIKGGIP